MRETVGKPKWVVILCFPVRKWGSKAGVPVETPKGSRWGVPLLETPHFPTRKDKITRIWIFQLFFATWLAKKRKQIIFLPEYYFFAKKKKIGKNLLCQNKFHPKIFVDQKFFRTKHFFWPKFCSRQKKFRTKIFFGPKFFLNQNIFQTKSFFKPKFFFGPKYFFGPKFFFAPTFFWTEFFF